MEDTNVNNLNGVPNFGHGFPDGVPEAEVIPDAASDTGVEVSPETVTDSGPLMDSGSVDSTGDTTVSPDTVTESGDLSAN